MKTTTFRITEHDDDRSPDFTFDAGGVEVDGLEQVRRVALVVHAAITLAVMLGENVGIERNEMIATVLRQVPALAGAMDADDREQPQ